MFKATLLFLGTILATATYSQSVRLVPNNTIAKIAGRMHGREDDYAITVGKTIYLSCSKEDFLSDTPWVRHEFTHIEQYRKYGVLEFVKRYLFFSIFRPYNKNPFEKEAIAAEGRKPKPKYDRERSTVSMSSY
jgi:hypothetical protein